jgi:glycosyltransferase involved in cell wall biosynthesis
MSQLEYICLWSNTGYSLSARDYILAINKANINVKINPLDSRIHESILGNNSFLFKNLLLKKLEKNTTQVYHCIPPMQQRLLNNRTEKTIGFGIIECNSIPCNWKDILNKNNVVITPSKFCKDVLIKNGVVKPIYVIPHALNSDIYYKSDNEKVNGTKFLAVGTYRNRKNFDNLIKGWIEAFDIKDNVKLTLKTDLKLNFEKRIKELTKGKNIAPIKIISEVWSDERMGELYRNSDCYISVSRGEGFGLGGLQAMASGCFIISPKVSGESEYLDGTDFIELKSSENELVENMDGYPQFRNVYWPIISAEEVSKALKNYVKNKNKFINNYDIKDKFSYSRIGQLWDDMLIKENLKD